MELNCEFIVIKDQKMWHYIEGILLTIYGKYNVNHSTKGTSSRRGEGGWVTAPGEQWRHRYIEVSQSKLIIVPSPQMHGHGEEEG